MAIFDRPDVIHEYVVDKEGRMDGHRISMLGTGLIGDFYTNTLHGQRSRDQVRVVYSRSEARGAAFRDRCSCAVLFAMRCMATLSSLLFLMMSRSSRLIFWTFSVSR